MKWDKLESYIKQNQDKLDEQIPPEAVWNEIDAKLPVKTSVNKMVYWQAAAVIFFILSIGLLFNNFRGDNNGNAIAGNNDEFDQTEQYYFNVIEDKEVLLTTYLENYPDLALDFKKDLQELGKNYQRLKADLKNNRSEEVLSALIQNLQLQQDLLNNQLKIINQITEENENVSI